MSCAPSASMMADIALDKIKHCLQYKESFLFDAGAGAGKTETLKRVLEHLLENEGSTLRKKNMKIACITYTKVAANEIQSRLNNDNLIHVRTIHSFCWDTINAFQPYLRSALLESQSWQERIAENGPIDNKPVFYRDSFPRITDSEVEIGHNDVLSLITHLMKFKKFRRVISCRFPYIFIDEYQDSDSQLIDAIKSNFLDTKSGPLIGFFGDAWQKIYPGVCGAIQHDKLVTIPAQSNFRSAPCIVEALNRMRPTLSQVPSRKGSKGDIVILHTNDWPDQRRTGSHWAGDLEADAAQKALKLAEKKLLQRGWDLSPLTSRRLLLTHSLMGREQGYEQITSKLHRDDFEELKNPILSFLHSNIETARRSFTSQSYGAMFTALGHRVECPKSHLDKALWAYGMGELESLSKTGTIGEVLENLISNPHIPVPQDIEHLSKEYALWDQNEGVQNERFVKKMKKYRDIVGIPYSEMVALSDYHRQLTGFKTQHGVKGDQFPTVIVALGRGWNHYNTDKFLTLFSQGVPADKQDSFERTRNLFYVACSRAKDNLCLLITQKLSDEALIGLETIFGSNAIMSLPHKQ